MPRIFTPRRDGSFPRRGSGASFGSRSSINSYGSRRASLTNPSYVSQFSLRRPDGSVQSSKRPQVVYGLQPSKQNAEWDLGDSQGPPSLVNSETSVQTDRSSLSRESSQSSLQQLLSPKLPPSGNVARYEALQQYYAHRGGMFPHNYRAAPRRSSLQYPSINKKMPRSTKSSSFLSQTEIQEEDVWGQFVDTSDGPTNTNKAEDDLVRRSQLLSISSRSVPTSLSRSGRRIF